MSQAVVDGSEVEGHDCDVLERRYWRRSHTDRSMMSYNSSDILRSIKGTTNAAGRRW